MFAVEFGRLHVSGEKECMGHEILNNFEKFTWWSKYVQTSFAWPGTIMVVDQ